ncbi:hypothetical protein ACFWMG_21290, partial [Streptomyces sp. NPDC127074]|uniref:hypothetical protein n=1 Tax=Streptomyces sp. NPDC127074 TaxID=3347130 RepID=UPI0036543BD6
MGESEIDRNQSGAESLTESSATEGIKELESSLDHFMAVIRCDADEMRSVLAAFRGEINALQEKVAELESRLDGVIVSWTRSRED